MANSNNLNVFGQETYFNNNVTFFKNVNIGGKLTTDDKIDASTLDLESLPELP